MNDISENKSPEIKEKSFHQIRRCILNMLYEMFQETPYATIELIEISEKCSISPKQLNWNIVYLEKCGFVELAKSYESPPFISPSAMITADGIDLIENESAFDKKFPL